MRLPSTQYKHVLTYYERVRKLEEDALLVAAYDEAGAYRNLHVARKLLNLQYAPMLNREDLYGFDYAGQLRNFLQDCEFPKDVIDDKLNRVQATLMEARRQNILDVSFICWLCTNDGKMAFVPKLRITRRGLMHGLDYQLLHEPKDIKTT